MHMRAVVLTSLLIVVMGIAGSLSTGSSAAYVPEATDGPYSAVAALAGWQTITTEGFEGAWPVSGWKAIDVNGWSDGIERYWGKNDYKPHGGAWSVWPASGGFHALDPEFNDYPDSLTTRIVYGPFDLSNALDAEASFWLWMEIEEGWDEFNFYASHDGVNFGVPLGSWSVNTMTWEEIVMNLSAYAGDSSVWVRWEFISDESNGFQGPFVDDITISKLPLDAPAVTISRTGSTGIRLEWPDIPDAASYEVWRGVNSPYFAPGADCAATPASCTVVTDNFYVHSAGGGSASDNHSYIVRSVKGSTRSVLSNRTGEFDFVLIR